MIAIATLCIALLQGATMPTDTTAALSQPDPVPAASIVIATPMMARPDTVPRRPRAKAVEVSDAYELRLRIHRYASYTTIPLFVAQTVAGNQLYMADQGGQPRPGWAKAVHSGGAAGLGALFTVNTVTGLWNLWETRDQTEGRGKRLLHSGLMLASDIGFTYAGVKLADDAKRSPEGRDRHRRVAYISMGTALAGYGIMLLGNH